MTYEEYGEAAMSELALREVAAPWFIREAQFDGVGIVLQGNRLSEGEPQRMAHGWVPEQFNAYGVAYGELPWHECDVCHITHFFATSDFGGWAYDGNSLEEAESAFADLERKLLAGELR